MLGQHKRVLMIGCGGGYDIYVGLPLYFELTSNNVEVKLANFSFTPGETLRLFPNIGGDVYKIKVFDTPNNFFPEAHLSLHLSQSVYAIEYIGGVVRLKESYRVLIQHLNPDCIILVDGGCDSLMFGYEESMATWVEDSMNLFAAYQLITEDIKWYLLVGGATADFYEGIKQSDLLKNISILKQDGALVWETVINSKQFNTRKYIFIFLNSAPHYSIVNASIVAAAQGIRGPYCPDYLHNRLNDDTLDISELTSTFWLFDLSAVCRHNHYLHLLDGIDDPDKIEEIVNNWRRLHLLK